MKTISALVSAVLVSAFALFAAPVNGTIDVASVGTKGDSVIVMIPIDFGQYVTNDAAWRINTTDKWYVWACFDKDNSYTVEAGKDVSVLVEGTVTTDGNHIRASFRKLDGYKGHVVWSAYQVCGNVSVPIWVNSGFNNKPGIPADKYGWRSSNNAVAFYHTAL